MFWVALHALRRAQSSWLRRAAPAVPGVERVVATGSLRRRETAGGVDLLVGLRGERAVMERFVHGGDVRQVLMHGATRASVVLRSGQQVDLRAVPAESFGAAWFYLTGSKAHNIALRKRARERGLKINECGVFRGHERIAGETEAPRQAMRLLRVQRADLRGDLHAHTLESDGHDSIESMAAAASARAQLTGDHRTFAAPGRGTRPRPAAPGPADRRH